MTNVRRYNVKRMSINDENCDIEGEERWDGRDKRRQSEPRKSIRTQITAQKCRGNQNEETIKERIADEMLEAAGETQALDCCTEDALLQRIHYRQVYRQQSNLESFESGHASEDSLNELKFLVSVTPLTRRERYFVRAWMIGWTQTETVDQWSKQFGDLPAGNISRELKAALVKCKSNLPIAFSQLSQHPIYRKPSIPYCRFGRLSYCVLCKKPYLSSQGSGAYCSHNCLSLSSDTAIE